MAETLNPTPQAADPLREAARLAMHACAQAACYFEANEIAEHGRRDLGETWSAVYEALRAAREALGFNRRFDFELRPDCKTYDLIDKAHLLGRTSVMRGYSLAETLVMADYCSGANVSPLELPPARAMECSSCGATTRGRQWPNRDTGYSLCGGCRDWFTERRESTYETARNYGVRGIHYDVRA